MYLECSETVSLFIIMSNKNVRENRKIVKISNLRLQIDADWSNV